MTNSQFAAVSINPSRSAVGGIVACKSEYAASAVLFERTGSGKVRANACGTTGVIDREAASAGQSAARPDNRTGGQRD